MKLKQRYERNKKLKVGDACDCPSCGTTFTKEHYQQKFCKSKGGTICKDKYWNLVTPTKRNNTKRISPANAAFREKYIERNPRDIEDMEHPFSSEALGQW